MEKLVLVGSEIVGRIEHDKIEQWVRQNVPVGCKVRMGDSIEDLALQFKMEILSNNNSLVELSVE